MALEALEPHELVVFGTALAGVVPIVAFYHRVGRQSTRWFFYAYGFFLVGAFATNFENLFLGEFLNFLEHGVGNMGAGIAVVVAAYVYRTNAINAGGETAAGAEG